MPARHGDFAFLGPNQISAGPNTPGCIAIRVFRARQVWWWRGVARVCRTAGTPQKSKFSLLTLPSKWHIPRLLMGDVAFEQCGGFPGEDRYCVCVCGSVKIQDCTLLSFRMQRIGSSGPAIAVMLSHVVRTPGYTQGGARDKLPCAPQSVRLICKRHGITSSPGVFLFLGRGGPVLVE